MRCLLRREYDPAALLAAHPPVLRHQHKRLVFELACPPDAAHRGPIVVTRWDAAELPERADLAATELAAVPGFYDYDAPEAGVWHVNFADPQLFVAYGSPLLAQDELQACEHPLLGSIREALGDEARTEKDLRPTPVLVIGVERRCTIDTAGLYGNAFARAPESRVRGAIHVHATPRRSNLIAMAAPAGGHGPYFHAQIERILVTAYTAFAAAVGESRATWPGAAVEVRTGFWGCGAFGGNRELMALLQILAARLAGVDRVRFYAAGDAGVRTFEAGTAALDRALAPGGTIAEVLERIDDLDYEWGTPDGT